MGTEPTMEEFKNPIDKDKVAENPGLLPYAHTVGGAIIRPIDKGRTKGLAMSAMYEQTNKQLDQIRKQVELLMDQAKNIHSRVEISERIYQADMGFRPVYGQLYFLYRKKDGTDLLSMVSPEEWGENGPYEFVVTVKLLSDSTWEILEGEI
jgi:Protein of unknown function (DUF2452)